MNAQTIHTRTVTAPPWTTQRNSSDSGNCHITRHRARRTVILLSELVFGLRGASFHSTLHDMKPLAIAIVLAALILTFGHSLDVWVGHFVNPPHVFSP